MLKGTITALITPFKNNEIDFESLHKLINFQIENNVNGILAAGTTGESPAFSDSEFVKLIKKNKEFIGDKAKLLAGTGSNNIDTAIERTKMAYDNGADYALVVTPYYNKPTQNGLYEHYKKIAESVNIPIIIYNVPGRTSCNILPDTVLKLSKIENIVGLKAASGDLNQINEVLTYSDDNFSVLSGDDGLNLPILSLGAHGVISVVSNILPNLVAEMAAFCLNNEFDKALPLHRKIAVITKYMFMETNPIPVKTSLNLMGFCTDEFRLPLVNISDENLEVLKRILKEFKLI